jgi:hypothetical protein
MKRVLQRVSSRNQFHTTANSVSAKRERTITAFKHWKQLDRSNPIPKPEYKFPTYKPDDSDYQALGLDRAKSITKEAVIDSFYEKGKTLQESRTVLLDSLSDIDNIHFENMGLSRPLWFGMNKESVENAFHEKLSSLIESRDRFLVCCRV